MLQIGSRIINILTPIASATDNSFNVKMPLTASANAIWNQAYHWSQGQNKWVPVTLVGTLYPGAQLNAAGRAWRQHLRGDLGLYVPE